MEDTCDFCGESRELLSIHRSFGSKKQTAHLCAPCAHSLGIRDEQMMIPIGPADLFDRILDPHRTSERNQTVCPQCGTGLSRIRHSGMVGCVHCFETFHNEIEMLLPRLTRRITHSGSLPKQVQFFRRLFLNKAALKERLETALHNEDYESAAHFRDIIQDKNSE